MTRNQFIDIGGGLALLRRRLPDPSEVDRDTMVTAERALSGAWRSSIDLQISVANAVFDRDFVRVFPAEDNTETTGKWIPVIKGGK